LGVFFFKKNPKQQTRNKMRTLVLESVAFLFLLLLPTFWTKDHVYQDEQVVPLYVNKIGPYSNPSESYDYYSLPFCKPPDVQHAHHHSLGEKLEGDVKQTSAYEIRFNVPIKIRTLCEKHLVKSEIRLLKQAIARYYYAEFVFDDLPIRGFIGAVDVPKNPNQPKRLYLFKHQHFNIYYNPIINGGGVIIYANMSSDMNRVVELKDQNELTVEFTYSVSWIKTNIPFSKRTQLQSITSKAELEIHWLSILNSFVLVILLTGFIAIIIMRILKSDYSRYARDDEEEGEADDYGWKLIHGDVFRFPPYKIWFCAFIGVGAQFLAMTIFMLLLALIGLYYPGNDGTLYVSAIILYALTAGIAGYVSNSLYASMSGIGASTTSGTTTTPNPRSWTWLVVLVSTVWGVPMFVVAIILNSIAAYYGSTSALSFSTIFLIILIWALIGFPLTLIGGIAGKRLATPFYAPVRTKNFPREIPPIPWYRQLPYQMLMAGFLPFSAIYIELFYIFNSVWGRASYQLFGILCLVFVILLIVTACITIALTYFQLSMEDYRWWWHSFLCGGSTGIFIYAYAVFYYVYRSNMSGFLQAAYYFGYMAVICYFFFIMLGTVGWYSSLVFVRKIYKNLHTE